MDLKKIKFKTGTAAIYVLALMLVGLGYWNYVSTESNNIQTVAETQTEKKPWYKRLKDKMSPKGKKTKKQ